MASEEPVTISVERKSESKSAKGRPAKTRSRRLSRGDAASINTVDGQYRFVEIKPEFNCRKLELIDIWTTVVPAIKSSIVLKHLKDYCPVDPVNLGHVRRLYRVENTDNSTASGLLLYLEICSTECVATKDEIQEILDGVLPGLQITLRKAPRYPASTKEENQEWSQRIWPCIWRGNPQLRPTELTVPDMERMRKHMLEAIDLVQNDEKEEEKEDNNRELPIASIIVDPSTDQVIARSRDSRRRDGNPINHSVMTCILEVAKQEQRRRRLEKEQGKATNGNSSEQNNNNNNNNCTDEEPLTDVSGGSAYLCHNLEMYSTHEPCTMCSMSLVHSRIMRLVYVKSMSQTGAIDPQNGAKYSVHDHRQLNWRFQAWRFEDLDNTSVIAHHKNNEYVYNIPDDVNA